MVVGGVLGGLLGNQVKGHDPERTVAVIAVAAIGGAIGHSMDETDRRKTGQVLENVRTGVSSSWRNPDSGNEYSVVPNQTYYEGETPCRKYSVDARIEGSREKVYGTACRQSDGRWHVWS